MDLELKETLGTVMVSDNAPAKIIILYDVPWHYDEPALYIFQSQCEK